MGPSSSRFLNRFVLAFAIFLDLILVGTSDYHWHEGMSIVGALYMTVITISTVRFGEVWELSPLRWIFKLALMMDGGRLDCELASIDQDHER